MKTLLLLALMTSSSLFALTIKGRVFEVNSKIELIGANVILKSFDEKKFILGTISDVDGKFTLNSDDSSQVRDIPAGKYKLEISFIGYMTIKEVIVVKNQKSIYVKAGLTSPAVFEISSRY